MIDLVQSERVIWKKAFPFNTISEHTKFSEVLTDDIVLKIEQISPSIAQVYFQDNDGDYILIPQGISIYDDTNCEDVKPLPEGHYLLCSTDTYVIYYEGREKFVLKSSRSWTIEYDD